MSTAAAPRELKQALLWAVEHLDAAARANVADPLPDARTDAEVLLGHVLGKPRSFLFTWPDHILTEAQRLRLSELIQRRVAGEPVAYLTGHAAFWTLDLETDPTTLIPRPDTETLVQAVLDRTPESPLDVVDLGTGTGAIALALASERSAWRVVGLDRAPAVVDLARRNGERNGLAQVRFLCSDWCAELAAHSVDLLISNPPYVRPDDPHLGQGDVRFEPASALIAEDAGLADFRAITEQSQRVLRAGGWLFFEHGFDQADDVALILIDAGFMHIETVQDMGGRPRVTLGQRPNRIL